MMAFEFVEKVFNFGAFSVRKLVTFFFRKMGYFKYFEHNNEVFREKRHDQFETRQRTENINLQFRVISNKNVNAIT